MFFKLGKYYRGYWAFVILCPLMMILEVFGDVLIPTLMESTIDDGVLTQNVDIVLQNGKYMIIVALLALAFGIASTYFGAKAGQGFGANLRHDLFTKIQEFSFASLDHFDVSSLITRLTSDVVFLSNLARMTLRMAIRAPFMFIMAIIMTIRINPRLSMIFLVALPILSLGIFLIMRKALPRFREFQKKIDQINRRTQENLTAIRVVKAFGQEDYEVEKFDDTNNQLITASLRAMNIVVLMMPLMMLVMFSVISSVLWFGGNLVITGDMTGGALFSFLMYVGQILTSVINISVYVMNLSRARASVERVLEVIETESEFTDKDYAGLAELETGHIKFENVNFRYPNTKHCSLRDIN
ncbi:MAG: ABC transporter ATP-binding protein, partial [Clostridiaceae bacterium]|nr:ABC transporter ATP-binding protein [Clostridiaceae bacterium]